MAGPLRKRRQGEKLKGIPVADWNRFVDATRKIEMLPMVSAPPPQYRRVRKGRVSTATAATFLHSGDAMTLGELEVWEAISPGDVADYDTAAAYVVGNFARQAGALYRCKTATADPAGAFSAGSWDEITPETDVELIDRTQDTVTIKHRFHEVAPEGALVEWDSRGIRILTCDAPTDWA